MDNHPPPNGANQEIQTQDAGNAHPSDAAESPPISNDAQGSQSTESYALPCISAQLNIHLC